TPASSTLYSWARYSRTRGTISGCVSQAMSWARPRTRARANGSVGSSGGCGWVSSRYSMMASDSNSIVPSFSISAGNAIIGLTLRKASSRCLPFMRSMSITSSGTMPLRLSAMRTRNVASERQNENSFTAPPLAEIVKEFCLPYYTARKKIWRRPAWQQENAHDFGRGHARPCKQPRTSRRGARRYAHRLGRPDHDGRRPRAARRRLSSGQGRPLSGDPELRPLCKGPCFPGRLSERLAAHGRRAPRRHRRIEQPLPELGGGRSREMGAARLRLPARRLAGRRGLARLYQSFFAAGNEGFLRLHRMGRRAAVVKRQGRTQRHLLLRHQSVA